MAISALGRFDFHIKIRETGEWYACCAAEIKRGICLVGVHGNGQTPEEAVDDLWLELTSLQLGEYLVLGAYTDRRRAVKWNGFMWDGVREKDAA